MYVQPADTNNSVLMATWKGRREFSGGEPKARMWGEGDEGICNSVKNKIKEKYKVNNSYYYVILLSSVMPDFKNLIFIIFFHYHVVL